MRVIKKDEMKSEVTVVLELTGTVEEFQAFYEDLGSGTSAPGYAFYSVIADFVESIKK